MTVQEEVKNWRWWAAGAITTVGFIVTWTWRTADYTYTTNTAMHDNARAVEDLSKSVTEKFGLTKDEIAKLADQTGRAVDKLNEQGSQITIEKFRNDSQDLQLKEIKDIFKETLETLKNIQPNYQQQRKP